MTPIPTRPTKSADAAASVLHRLARRGEGGRIAGILVGCLIGGIAAVALVYLCFNCALAPGPPRKTAQQPAHAHVHRKAHPHLHRAPSSHAPPMALSHTHTHQAHRDPRVHRHRHHGCKAKPRKKQRPEAKRKTEPQPARHDRRPPRARGPTVPFMPMPPMAAMPTAPPARAVGTGTPLGDGFVDFGPAPDQDDLGLGMGWDAGPGFLLEESAAEKDARGDADAACNECCYSFFDALCGVPKGARDLRREAAGDGEVVLEDNETAAV